MCLQLLQKPAPTAHFPRTCPVPPLSPTPPLRPAASTHSLPTTYPFRGPPRESPSTSPPRYAISGPSGS